MRLPKLFPFRLTVTVDHLRAPVVYRASRRRRVGYGEQQGCLGDGEGRRHAKGILQEGLHISGFQTAFGRKTPVGCATTRFAR